MAQFNKLNQWLTLKDEHERLTLIKKAYRKRKSNLEAKKEALASFKNDLLIRLQDKRDEVHIIIEFIS